MTDWRRVAMLSDLAEDAPHAVELDGKPVVLVRAGDMVHAVDGECPHAGARLAEGAVCDGRLVCPWHMASFRLDDGGLVEPPAMTGLGRYPTRIRDGAVELDPERQAPSAPAARDPADRRTLLIAGGGAAAAMAATTLRHAGYAGRLVVVDPRAEEPVDRTVLSKMALSGEMGLDEIALWPDGADTPLAIERIAGRIAALDAGTRVARCMDGTEIRFDAALIATGGTPRPLPVPGGDGEGVFTLRARDDVAAIRDAIGRDGAAVVIGTSFIGLEAAAALTEAGHRVTVVGPDAAPFAKQFGDAPAAALLALHRAKGVRFRLGEEVAAIERTADGIAVALRGGDRITGRIALVGIGVRPATDFVTGVTHEPDGGLRVDDRMQAADAIYAAGDVAAVAGTRVEHWRTAQQQAHVAARNMLGGSARLDIVPFVWTAHFGKRIGFLGHPGGWDRIETVGDLAALQVVVLYVDGDRVVAALGCERDAAMAWLAERLRRPLPIAEARNAILARQPA